MPGTHSQLRVGECLLGSKTTYQRLQMLSRDKWLRQEAEKENDNDRVEYEYRRPHGSVTL